MICRKLDRIFQASTSSLDLIAQVIVGRQFAAFSGPAFRATYALSPFNIHRVVCLPESSPIQGDKRAQPLFTRCPTRVRPRKLQGHFGSAAKVGTSPASVSGFHVVHRNTRSEHLAAAA